MPFKDVNWIGTRLQVRLWRLNGILTDGQFTFLIKSTASSEGVKRVIETVLDTTSNMVRYWKEY